MSTSYLVIFTTVYEVYMVYNAYILHSNCNLMLFSFCLLFANFQKVTTLLNTLMHSYNNYLFHGVLKQVMTLYIM